MTIMVTGASGFIGRRLIPALAEQGHVGYAVSRQPVVGPPAGWTWLGRSAALQGPAFGQEPAGPPAWVIHLEVKQHVPAPTPDDGRAFTEVNVEGTRAWLEWCAGTGVSRFLHFSTIKAVGDSDDVQDESADSAPHTLYGQSKRAAEILVRAWAQQNDQRSAVIVRSAVVYGPGNHANLLSMVKAIDRGWFFLAGRNDNVKSIVSLRNVMAAVAYLLPRAGRGCSVYNLVDERSYSVREIARMMAEALGKRSPRSCPRSVAWLMAEIGEALTRLCGGNFLLSRSRYQALVESTHFSSHKLVSAGFVHPQSTAEGIAEMVAWYLAD